MLVNGLPENDVDLVHLRIERRGRPLAEGPKRRLGGRRRLGPGRLELYAPLRRTRRDRNMSLVPGW